MMRPLQHARPLYVARIEHEDGTGPMCLTALMHHTPAGDRANDLRDALTDLWSDDEHPGFYDVLGGFYVSARDHRCALQLPLPGWRGDGTAEAKALADLLDHWFPPCVHTLLSACKLGLSLIAADPSRTHAGAHGQTLYHAPTAERSWHTELAGLSCWSGPAQQLIKALDHASREREAAHDAHLIAMRGAA
jgi:hypothetical protein